jgi:hypothetical protein
MAIIRYFDLIYSEYGMPLEDVAYEKTHTGITIRVFFLFPGNIPPDKRSSIQTISQIPADIIKAAGLNKN